MSNAGVFTILTNDGKQDRLITATAVLSQRLGAIYQNLRRKYPRDDPETSQNLLPSISDVQKSHLLFVAAHFKPYASLGFEYSKLSNTSAAWGGDVVFNLPQFGDFFNDIVLHAVIAQPTLTSTASGAATASDAPAMRWCDYPGERLIKNAKMTVASNELDAYTLNATTFHRLYRVSPNKLTGWQKCVGQEIPTQGFLTQPGVLGAAAWSYSGSVDSNRFRSVVHNGNQTPSGQKSGSLELFVPLLFWFCTDVRLSLPAIAISPHQRFITLTLATQNEIVGMVPRGAATWDSPSGTLAYSGSVFTTFELYINNIFLTPEVHKIYLKRVGFHLIRVHREQTIPVSNSSGEFLLQAMKWPLEYMFVGGKVTANIDPTTDGDMRKTLDTWHLFSQYTDTNYRTTGQEVEYLQQLAYLTATPATVGTVGIATSTGALTGSMSLCVAVAAGDTLRIGGNNYVVTTGAAAAAAVTGVVVQPVPDVTVSASTAYKVTKQGQQTSAKVLASNLTTLGVKAQSVSMYQDFPIGFYNGYTAASYGGTNIHTPTDPGTAFIPFCLYPGTYQPSGHINVSRAREFYLSYTSAIFASGTPGKIYVLGSCINFLLVGDGSAILRFST